MRKIFTIGILTLIAITPIFTKDSYNINAPQLTNANIVFAADIIRHGARTSTQYDPKLKYPPLWNVDNIPAGQLTQYVFEMERYNGEYFSKEYYKLLGNQYNREDICIVADDTNRDIVSAQAVLLGMLPHIKNSDVIEIIPKAKDPMLSIHKNIKNINAAPGWLDEWRKIGYLSEVLVKHNYISKDDYCDTKVSTPIQAYKCIQPIAKFAAQLIPLKDYCSKSGCSVFKTYNALTKSDITDLIEVFNFNSYYSAIPAQSDGFTGFTQDYLQNSINSNGAVVISQIIFDIKQIISNPNNKKYPKYILFVGHDTGIRFNIAYLLSKANKIKTILTTNHGYGADLSFIVNPRVFY
ncbi:histidine acid phosphatase [Francisella tularensis subsp. holarctica PHIT-FT049]|uniref:histidine phosphatase family protein n=1 Tax=Francisella tularensis TaxID=263 RepID=UPI0003E767A6|nr:histidine acid phosphatase [Francisella tularensis subsp. holarctica PHIT-FT049]